MISETDENLYRVYRVLALFWMAVLYWLSSKSTLPVPDLFWGQDKLEHAVAFGLLGLLFAASFRRGGNMSFGRRLIVVTILVGAYGLLDEAHQLFVPGRDASLWDVCADVTGGFLSALFFLKYKARKFSRQNLSPLS